MSPRQASGCNDAEPSVETEGEWSSGEHQRQQQDLQKHVGSLLSSLKSSLYLAGSVLIVLAALHNTLSWYFVRILGGSMGVWQFLWDAFYDHCGRDTFTVIVYGSFVVGFTVFWTVGMLYAMMDVLLKPHHLRRYKIQPGVNEPVDTGPLLQAVLWVLINQTVIGVPLTWCFYHIHCLRGFDSSPQLPTVQRVLFDLAICMLVEEIAFYYSHRLLHHRWMYARVHKWHHEWTSPIAITAMYCHPLEHVMSNYLPPMLGVLLAGSHPATCLLWFSLATLFTLNAHSGYHLPFLPSPEAHDFHHLRFNQCYGVLGVLDRVHGTNAAFRASTAYQRHLMHLTLVPPREAYPDHTSTSHSLNNQHNHTTSK